jgi:predicted RecB family endonuclease
MRDKGSELEDTVANYFRQVGFDVEARVKMKDHFDVFHEIDVVASKQEDFGRIQVAVECKFVSGPMDIKEIRNFHDKLSALGFTKGVFVSTGGFTSDAESHAAALGMELWDERMLEQKLSKLTSPQTGVVHDVLPVRTEASAMIPRHLRNHQLLHETVVMSLAPFYFMEYKCFSQHSVAGNAVVIESKGALVLDAVSGRAVGFKAREGAQPASGTIGQAFAELLNFTPVDSPSFGNIPRSVTNPKIDSSLAKDSARTELVKRLSTKYSYHTPSTYQKRQKILQPKKKDVEILEFRHVRVPILTGIYKLRNFTYTRTCLASTSRLIHDDLAACTICKNPPSVVCVECGAAVCQSNHTKTCATCAKDLCSSCVVSKGILSKKHYCKEHAPKN